MMVGDYITDVNNNILTHSIIFCYIASVKNTLFPEMLIQFLGNQITLWFHIPLFVPISSRIKLGSKFYSCGISFQCIKLADTYPKLLVGEEHSGDSSVSQPETVWHEERELGIDPLTL